MLTSTLLALAASITSTSAVYQGFNYGSTFTTGAPKLQADFEAEFNTAKGLVGASGFTAARLYTTIQANTANDAISAIPAAIATQTQLLLGLWASAGQADMDNEIAALTAAIGTYGTNLTTLLVGISVGSEDLYRSSAIGVANKAGVGAEPSDLVSYIGQVKAAIAGTAASATPVGHVDTWTSYVNSSNNAVIAACDFLGVDAYPYFQPNDGNSISNGANLFFEAYYNTTAAAQGKPVWITETGWPVSGPVSGAAVPSPANAQTYWQGVACQVLGKINTFWFTLQDAEPDTPSPSFGLIGGPALTETPLFDLSCPVVSSSTSASSSATPSTALSVATPSSVASAPTFSAKTVTATSLPVSVFGTSVASSTGTSAASSVAPSSVAASSLAPSSAATSASSVAGSSTRQTITIKSTVYATTTDCSAATASDVTVTESVTYTVCEGACAGSTTIPVVSSPSVAASSVVTPLSSIPVYSTPAPVSSAASAPTPSASGCPNSLSGLYQYPHLIVPVNSSAPATAFGTQYFGEFSSTVSTVFNFDIPQSYQGKTCTLVFTLPLKSQLETSDYTLSGVGGLTVNELKSAATQQTTYDTVPATAVALGTTANLVPGNAYTITSHTCGAGLTASFEISATGSLDLYYFQDWNPCPLGLFITAA